MPNHEATHNSAESFGLPGDISVITADFDARAARSGEWTLGPGMRPFARTGRRDSRGLLVGARLLEERTALAGQLDEPDSVDILGRHHQRPPGRTSPDPLTRPVRRLLLWLCEHGPLPALRSCSRTPSISAEIGPRSRRPHPRSMRSAKVETQRDASGQFRDPTSRINQTPHRKMSSVFKTARADRPISVVSSKTLQPRIPRARGT
jgi:hypothetical protein